MPQMTSKERILSAFKSEEVDYIPCSIYFNKNLRIQNYDMNSAEDVIRLHKDLGVDPYIDLPAVHSSMSPEVKTRTWVEDIKDMEYPILFKEYATPAGNLRQGVKLTPQWPYGKDIPFPGNDFCASHNYESLIKSDEDVEAFKYLFCPPAKDSFYALRDNMDAVKGISRKYGVPLRAFEGGGLAMLMFVMGAQNLVYYAMDYPEAFQRLAGRVSEVSIASIRLLKEAGADFIKRFGGYEQTNFFSPEIFNGVVVPLLKREVKEAKKVGIPIYYRVVTGMKPLLETIAGIGFDCVEGFEPCLSDCTNQDIYNALGKKTCIWTGISSPGHIGGQDEAGVRKAVRDAVQVFGRKGFILGITNSIRNHWPWANTLAMIDEWKKIR